jgi:hypothetical protein
MTKNSRIPYPSNNEFDGMKILESLTTARDNAQQPKHPKPSQSILKHSKAFSP